MGMMRVRAKGVTQAIRLNVRVKCKGEKADCRIVGSYGLYGSCTDCTDRVRIVRIPDTNIPLTVRLGPHLLYFGGILGPQLLYFRGTLRLSTSIFWRYP